MDGFMELLLAKTRLGRGSERPKDKTTKRKFKNIKNITRMLPKYNIY